MRLVLPASEIGRRHRRKVGGKAFALSRLLNNGITIPDTLCITGDAYRAYVSQTGLRERISLELHRKEFSRMRWEEIWDCATRIRSLFLRVPIPSAIEADLKVSIESCFSGTAVAVRSSALDEDGTSASFAGLHESFVNIRGVESILKHVCLVWASLWSDAALLYRQEIGLDVEKSAMAVVVQEVVAGDRSGVAFTRNPVATSQGVIESVHGMNQGLVDGIVAPDRWIVDRRTHEILSHTPTLRHYWLVPGENGVHKAPLPRDVAQHPPLNPQEVRAVFDVALQAEEFFDAPQDVEWTFRGHDIHLLQSRPITTLKSADGEDKRGWYLSLHRSFENLKALRERIETEFIPAMVNEAGRLSKLDLNKLSDQELAAEIKRRWEINQKWVTVYWEEFIPFAHGIRLFGQFYNDAVQPDDPYEFIDLLSDTQMVSVKRNRMLVELADMIRNEPGLAENLSGAGHIDETSEFNRKVEHFIREYGDLSCSVTGGTQCLQAKEPLVNILLEMAAHPPVSKAHRGLKRIDNLKKAFLNRFGEGERTQAAEKLDLARTSYQLRDDDNIYLGRIESQLLAAIQAARRRVFDLNQEKRTSGVSQILVDLLADLDRPTSPKTPEEESAGRPLKIKPRQLIGQPAGPGIARGRARVIRKHSDLADFQHGDVMVCDAVDPNMTFVVPLAAAVVERRGGMLIHGAIIAREYGLPCVTGIPDATTLVRTGEEVTVDGYLGIVTVGTGEI
ncbi:MAG: PEP/pyruvate-binding domain-containing protein [Desulfobacterales bacterium]